MLTQGETKDINEGALASEQNKTEIEKMIAAGVYFGHKTNRKHPKMAPYIHGMKGGFNVIDINKTEEKLMESLNYIDKLISNGGVIMVVGTKVQLIGAIKLFAEECGLPYVLERWLGGTFTNFENIKKRVDYLKDLEKKKEDGEFDKHTKKERLNLDREIVSLKKRFEGLKSLSKLPDAVLILDMEKDDLVVKEARMKNVIVVGITDTNTNPELADYPIPANDDAVSSVEYILDRIKKRILEVKDRKRLG